MATFVLQHGLFGFDHLALGQLKFTYFRGIDQVIRERGHRLIVPRVHPTESVATRAKQMRAAIEPLLLPGERVVIIAHSMGGLDARYLIRSLGFAPRVSALVTLCTPHRGSPYADWCVEHLGRRLGALRLLKQLRLEAGALANLTTSFGQRFNARVPDHPDVRYFSVSAARPWHKIQPHLLPSFKIVHEAEGDNDGLVSVTSSTWGEHLGVWPVDHMHAINHRLFPELVQRSGSVRPRYAALLEDLERHGVT